MELTRLLQKLTLNAKQMKISLFFQSKVQLEKKRKTFYLLLNLELRSNSVALIFVCQ